MANYLKKRIMRRVYAIWFVRRALPMAIGSVGSVYLALRLIADSFFVAEIMRSFKVVLGNNIWGLPKYIEAALNNVEPHVLILVSMGGLIGFALAVKLLRSVRQIFASPYSVAAAEARR